LGIKLFNTEDENDEFAMKSVPVYRFQHLKDIFMNIIKKRETMIKSLRDVKNNKMVIPNAQKDFLKKK